MHRFFAPCCVILGVLASSLPVHGQTEKSNPCVIGDELRSLLEKARAKHDVPALATGIISAGNNSHVAVVGVRKRGTNIAATPADQWHLGSNTKPFTALLIALLIDRGLLEWDTPLEEIFPD